MIGQTFEKHPFIPGDKLYIRDGASTEKDHEAVLGTIVDFKKEFITFDGWRRRRVRSKIKKRGEWYKLYNQNE